MPQHQAAVEWCKAHKATVTFRENDVLVRAWINGSERQVARNQFIAAVERLQEFDRPSRKASLKTLVPILRTDMIATEEANTRERLNDGMFSPLVRQHLEEGRLRFDPTLEPPKGTPEAVVGVDPSLPHEKRKFIYADCRDVYDDGSDGLGYPPETPPSMP